MSSWLPFPCCQRALMFLIYLLVITELQTSTDEINVAQDADLPLSFPPGVSAVSKSKACENVIPPYPTSPLRTLWALSALPELRPGWWKRKSGDRDEQSVCREVRGRQLPRITRAEPSQLLFMRLLFQFRMARHYLLFLATNAVVHLYL